MRVVRTAGTVAAIRATPAKTTAAPAKMNGSWALTPRNRLGSGRVTTHATAEPMTTPAPTSAS